MTREVQGPEDGGQRTEVRDQILACYRQWRSVVQRGGRFSAVGRAGRRCLLSQRMTKRAAVSARAPRRAAASTGSGQGSVSESQSECGAAEPGGLMDCWICGTAEAGVME